MRKQIEHLIIYGLLILFFSCSKKEPENNYPCLHVATNWGNSNYVLPFPVGKSYYVNQANCSGYGHSGFWNHGYDFTMPIGTIVTASRRGTVGWANDGCQDGDAKCTNLITIIHEDGTVALYSHLTNGGVFVKPGDLVEAGDTIGKSGNTGNTGGLPHLHFSVHPCNQLPGLPNPEDCPSLPVNFRNTDANPTGLITKTTYQALEYYPCLQVTTYWENSSYVLPFPVGEAYFVNQANCSGYGHSGFWNHGYDFSMSIGTIVTAARRGKVGWANDGCTDGNSNCTNLITIIHEDGTVALYSHLTNGGVLVKTGDIVEAGDTIGKSGNTGNTGGLPHLHFSVHPCNQLPGLPNAGDCPSLPVNFRNTDPNPTGLIAKRTYQAKG